MKLFVSIHHDHSLLPAFLAHYRDIGISKFYVCIFGGVSNPAWKPVEAHEDCIPVAFGEPGQPFYGGVDSTFQDELRRKYVGPKEWYATADLDEFAVLDVHRGYSVQQAVFDAETMGFTSVCGELLDRVTADGSFPQHVESDIWTQFPVTAEVTKYLVRGNTTKQVLARGDVPIRSGHHVKPSGNEHWRAAVYHFKWRGDLYARMKQRAKDYKDANVDWRIEPERVIEHLEKNGGKLNIRQLSHMDALARICERSFCNQYVTR